MKLVLASASLSLLGLVVAERGSCGTAAVSEKLPLYFEPNRGQTSPAFHYLARPRGYTVFLNGHETVFVAAGDRQDVVRMEVVGGRQARGHPTNKLDGVSNYVSGDLRLFGIPHFAAVQFPDVLPGVGIVYYGNGNMMEYDVIVAPGVEIGRIRLKFSGQRRLRVGPDGELRIELKSGVLLQQRPAVYQERAGRREKVAGRYVLHSNNEVGFSVGRYDRGLALVIDPTLMFSSYIGSTGLDGANAVAADAAGNLYLAGETQSTQFPLINPTQPAPGGATDAFVSKVNSSGTSLVYSTFLGGNGEDGVRGLALDSAGNAYVVGYTYSTNFPLQTPLYATGESFVAKLNPSGNGLVYSTRFGAVLWATAATADGSAIIVGAAHGTAGPPVVNAYQSSHAGVFDAVVAKLTPSGNGVSFSTYLGGSGADYAYAVGLDPAGNIWVGGKTKSTDMPVLGAKQGGNGGLSDGWLARFSAAGQLLFGTYVGGSGWDAVNAVAVNPAGGVFLGGHTDSPDLPVRNARQSQFAGGGMDGWVAALPSANSNYTFLTFHGGASMDEVLSMAAATDGTATAAGYSNFAPTSLATVLPTQASHGNQGNIAVSDAFVSRFTSLGSLSFSTFLGGSEAEEARGVAVGPSTSIYLAGRTFSSNLALASSSGPVYGGSGDAFAAKIQLSAACPVTVSQGVGSFFSYGGSGSIFVSAAINCAWSVSPGQSWITITSGANGLGSGTVVYSVSANSNTGVRLGALQFDSGAAYPVRQDGAVGSSCSPASINLNQTVTGVLSTTDCLSPQTSRGSDFYVFNATSAQTVLVESDSGTLLTAVAIYNTTGELLASCGNGCATTTKASVLASLPGAGTYLIEVSTRSGGTTGSYSLRVGDTSGGGLRFVPMTPCRVMETRSQYNFEGRAGAFGPPALNAGDTRTLDLPVSNVCVIPATAKAYVINVTLLPSPTVNFATVYPAGETRPNVWTIRSPDGQIVANSTIVKAGTNGGISVYTSDRADMLIDISGYYTDSNLVTGLAYYPLTPCRVVETRSDYRSPAGAFGPPTMSAGQTRTFRFPSSPHCIIPAAAAYSVTVTVVPPAPLAYLTAWPNGSTQPNVSSINSFAGRVLANTVIVPASTDGSINLFTYNTSDVIVDITGYYAPDDGTGRGLFYFPVTQCRASDSTVSGGIYAEDSTRTIGIASASGCSGIPATAQAYSIQVTALPNGNPMPFLTAYPTGQPRPNASILNAFQGQVVTNGAIIPAGTGGSIDIYAYRRTNVVVEVNGYFGR